MILTLPLTLTLTLLACSEAVRPQDSGQPLSPTLESVEVSFETDEARFSALCSTTPALQDALFRWTLNGDPVDASGPELQGLSCEDEVICNVTPAEGPPVSSGTLSPDSSFDTVLVSKDIGGSLRCRKTCGSSPPAPFSWTAADLHTQGPVLWPQARDGQDKQCHRGQASLTVSPEPATPRWQVSFDSKEPSRLGFEVIWVGDMDGDGGGELALAMPYWEQPRPKTGGVALVRSETLGTQDHHSLSATWTGEGSADLAGWALAAAGDVDGDGLQDLLVGVPGDERGAYLAGAVALFTGADLAAGVAHSGQASRLWTADTARMWAGAALAGGADLDGDGSLDLLVGAYGDDSDAGAVFLLDAQSPSGSLSDPVLRGSPGSATGLSLAIIGDTDGDGVIEWVAGAPLSDSLWWVQGDAQLQHTPSDTVGGYFGWKVASFGDIDGDGLPDWGASEPGGGAWVHTAQGWQDLGMPSTGLLGMELHGQAVVLISHQGSVWLHTPEGAELLYTSTGGVTMAALPDLDGDGQQELLLGLPGAEDESGGALLLLDL